MKKIISQVFLAVFILVKESLGLSFLCDYRETYNFVFRRIRQDMPLTPEQFYDYKTSEYLRYVADNVALIEERYAKPLKGMQDSIIKAAESSKEKKRALVILGESYLDIPLEQLAAMFDEVVVMGPSKALLEAVKNGELHRLQSDSSETRLVKKQIPQQLRNKIKTVPYDYTGGVIDRLLRKIYKFYKVWSVYSHVGEVSIDSFTSYFRKESVAGSPLAQLEQDDSFDLVVSPRTVNDFLTYPISYINYLFDLNYQLLQTNSRYPSDFDVACYELLYKLVRTHFDELFRTSRESGRVFVSWPWLTVSTDPALSESQRISSQRRMVFVPPYLVRRLADLFPESQSKEWEWYLNDKEAVKIKGYILQKKPN